jgi:predicted nucleic acid-binding protein
MGGGEVDGVTVIVDNTVLSNFASVGRLDLLAEGLGGLGATTEAVLREFRSGIEKGHLAQASLGWLPVLPLTAEEATTCRVISLRLGAGEASCLAAAQHRGLCVATDDGDARRYARQTGVPVSGTVGILVSLVTHRHTTLGEANVLLAQMAKTGYRSPLSDLAPLLGPGYAA